MNDTICSSWMTNVFSIAIPSTLTCVVYAKYEQNDIFLGLSMLINDQIQDTI